MTMNELAGKVTYGAAFCLLLPAGLVAWARATAAVVPLPVPDAPLAGAGCAGLGALLMAWAMSSLWREGQGLPMNAYPPRQLVSGGLYRWLPHPIYVGASLLSVGVALLTHSSSGLWLVSPVLTLAWLALVYGFENADLQCRFPGRGRRPAGRRWPRAAALVAPFGQRVRVAVAVFGPWLLLYETVLWLGPSRQPVSTFLAVEHGWPVGQWTEIFYLLAYPFAVAAPLVLRARRQLRQFAVAGWLATGAGGLLHLTLPFVAVARPFVPTTAWGHWLALERAHDGATAALPSFHVVWAGLAAHFWARRFPRFRALSYGLGLAISLSCLTTGMHSLLDVAAGALLATAVLNHRRLWRGLRRRLERLANSWSARQLGPLRVLNHSLYAGLAMLAGVLLTSSLLPGAGLVLPPVVLGVVGAGLWGQLVESSSGLSRPFGYYGSLLGGLAGCGVAAWLGPVSFWEVLAACTLALPLVQGVGRLRCLVQGCCHGRPGPARVGIRVAHPRSRVCELAHLGGRPVHATPAYSMLANLLTGLVLFRLAYERVPAPLLIGSYLILSGLARFVEEHFRGEPQTPRLAGLKLYQWLAFATVLLGILLTTWPAPPTHFHWRWHPAALPVAGAAALLAAFAMGMDFPASTRKFSRLAGS